MQTIFADAKQRELRLTSMDSKTPPIPIPSGKDDLLPAETPKQNVSTSTDKFNLWWDHNDDSARAYVMDPDPTNTTPVSLVAFPAAAVVTNFWGMRPAYTLTLRRWWRRVVHVVLNDGGSYAETLSFTHGVSKTDSISMAVEVGVTTGDVGLSAALSATFETSITISDEVTEQRSFSYTAPENTTVVFVIWQLMEEIAALDASNNVVNWGRDVFTARIQGPMRTLEGSLLLEHPSYTYATNIYQAVATPVQI